jgi:hypothetical protein
MNIKGNNGAHEVLLGADGNGGVLSTMTDHDLQLRAGGNSTKMTVKANGNVGIGTTYPTAKLDVNGDFKIKGGAPFVLRKFTGNFNGAVPTGFSTQDYVVSVIGFETSSSARVTHLYPYACGNDWCIRTTAPTSSGGVAVVNVWVMAIRKELADSNF